MRFYDFKRHWTARVMPHLANPEFNAVLVADFNVYTEGMFGQAFKPGDLPEAFDNGDWRLMHSGRLPRFWSYVASGACHWLVNANLCLAGLAEPERPWRIVTSAKHSTVWDGRDTLFDMNAAALVGDADETMRLARRRELPPGRYRRLHGTPQRPQAVRA